MKTRTDYLSALDFGDVKGYDLKFVFNFESIKVYILFTFFVLQIPRLTKEKCLCLSLPVCKASGNELFAAASWFL